MKRIRVLIVEDEPIIAADLEDRLDEMGYEVANLCDSGEAALSVLKETAVDLILMDVQLAGALDGIETAQKISEKQTIPIIFLTSNADDETFSRAKTTNPAAFLSKPFRGKDLKHAIELAITRAARPLQEETAASKENDAFLFTDRIFVKSKDRMIRIFFSDILWFEADDYYCKLITRDKEHLIGQTLKQMEVALAGSPVFMRVHRSFMINLAHVEEIGDLYVTIHKKQIPLNKTSREAITAHLQKI
jgi:DNA-binding LytR/AlgR family response regulator